jgi:hypothetical protein
MHNPTQSDHFMNFSFMKSTILKSSFAVGSSVYMFAEKYVFIFILVPSAYGI